MTKTFSSPSGSRWEPVATGPTGLEGPAATAPVPARPGIPEDRRRRGRQPVLVALVALLSLGATGGAAYELATHVQAAGSSAGQRAADGRDGSADGPADTRPGDGTATGGHHRGPRTSDGPTGPLAGASS